MAQPPRIAIPIPTSNNPDYNTRAFKQYTDAITASGGEPVVVPLDLSPHQVAQLITTCQAVLLPGSPNDINPHKYGEEPVPECAAPDPAREAVDELLIQDAHNLHKPILGICAGTQALNVWRNGSLIQHLPAHDHDDTDDDTPPVNHRAGREVIDAHPAEIADNSLLKDILEKLDEKSGGVPHAKPTIPRRNLLKNAENYTFCTIVDINSSHHQAIGTVGDGLRVVARCPQDAVVEAVEGTNPDHFLLGVQWHPERLKDDFSRAIFDRFVSEAARWKPRTITESVG
jgi:putative glutamine amidotransferase